MQPGDESINSIRLRLPIPLKMNARSNLEVPDNQQIDHKRRVETLHLINLIERWDIRSGDSSHSDVICLTSSTSTRVASHPAMHIISLNIWTRSRWFNNFVFILFHVLFTLSISRKAIYVM